MSLQVSILKVLAGQPGGRATVADLNRTLALLNVPEWTARMKRLSALAPDLDIFGAGYVVRSDAGWQLTDAGHGFLAAMEMPDVPATPQQAAAMEIVVTLAAPRQTQAPPLRLVADNRPERQRAHGGEHPSGRSAVA